MATAQTSLGRRAVLDMTATERNYWSSESLLEAGHGKHLGHLRTEVWADGFVCLSMTDPRLMGAALAALSGSPARGQATRSLPDHAVMTEHKQAQFLGRVLVEFWSEGAPAIGVVGAQPDRLLSLTVKRLRQMD